MFSPSARCAAGSILPNWHATRLKAPSLSAKSGRRVPIWNRRNATGRQRLPSTRVPPAELAGGIYGVAIGGFFAGESMFTRRRDASKVALVHLVERLRQKGFQLFDTQFVTEHTTRLGAVEIPRAEYLVRLRRALAIPATF